jgi:hypothetical protein
VRRVYMADKVIRTGKVTIPPGEELPYVGQAVKIHDEYYSILQLAKLEWVDNGIRVCTVMERFEEESVVVTEAELRKAKKSKFKLV